jgi:hypothetical protein
MHLGRPGQGENCSSKLLRSGPKSPANGQKCEWKMIVVVWTHSPDNIILTQYVCRYLQIFTDISCALMR